jgi:hypothetical protein
MILWVFVLSFGFETFTKYTTAIRVERYVDRSLSMGA